MAQCGCCGIALNDPQRMDIRVGLPDFAFDLPESSLEEVNAGLLRVDGGRSFVRCLLPVALTGGTEVVFGTWMEISPADLERTAAVWDDPAYASLVLHGTFANGIKPWGDGLLGAPVTAVVRNVDEIPYVQSSENDLLRRVLAVTWDRDVVLSCFGHPLPVHVRTKLSDHWSVERTAGLAAGVVDRTSQFTGSDRAVFADVLVDNLRRTPAEFLHALLEGAPEVPVEQTMVIPTEDDITHAFWLQGEVDGRVQHDFYAHVVRRGTALSIGCFYDDARDHAWAMHVLRSVAYQD
jgi:hypothetical protein